MTSVTPVGHRLQISSVIRPEAIERRDPVAANPASSANASVTDQHPGRRAGVPGAAISPLRAPLLFRRPPRPSEPPVLYCDRSPEANWYFRSASEIADLPVSVNTLGLGRLSLSGSGSISTPEHVQRIATVAKGEFLVVSLRQEAYAAVGGHPVSWIAPEDWGNIGKTSQEIVAEERQLVDQLHRMDSVQLFSHQDAKVASDSPWSVTLAKPRAIEEEALIRAGGGQFARLMVTDHLRPDCEQVDEFVALIRKAAKLGTWVHVHCKGGRGRTSTHMTMYDMLYNARQVSATEILYRQTALGGSDLTETGGKRAEQREDRLSFVLAFHEYCRENPIDAPHPRTWSEWQRELPDPTGAGPLAPEAVK